MTKEEMLLFREIQKDIKDFNQDLKDVAKDTNETKTSVEVIKTKMENLVTVPNLHKAIKTHEDTKHKNSIIPQPNVDLKKRIGYGAGISAGAGGVFYALYELINVIVKYLQ